MDSLIQHIILDKLQQRPEAIGLFKGQMGICLALFEDCAKDERLQHTAEELLSNICSQIDKTEDLTFSNGISGIGWAISRLHSEGFIEGNIDEILVDVDASIYRHVYDPTTQLLDVSLANGILGYTIYAVERIKHADNNSESMQIRLLKELTRKLIDRLFVTLPQSLSRIGMDVYTTILWDIPIAFLLFKDIIDLNIYPNKIENMLKSWEVYLTNRIPHYEINKLAYLTALYKLNQSVNCEKWSRLTNDRLRFIDFNKIESEIDCRLRDVNEGWLFFALTLNEALTTISPSHPSHTLIKDTLRTIIDKYYPSFKEDLDTTQGKDYKITFIDGLSGILFAIKRIGINKQTHISNQQNQQLW